MRGFALAVLLAAAVASGQERRVTFDIPDVVARIPVSEVMRVGGLPVQIVAVRSKWHWVDLQKELSRQIEKAGLFVSPRPVRLPGLDNPYVTALDTERRVSYTFILTPEIDGTTVFIGEVDHKQREAAPAGNAVAPLFPGAKSVLVTRQESADVVTYTAAASAAEVDAFYAEVLPTSGFKQTEPRNFEGAGQQFSLSVVERGPKVSTVVVIRRGAGVRQ